jgi:hypothetical protein
VRYAFWLSVLTLAAVIVRLVRNRAPRSDQPLTDDMVRHIEQHGTLRVEDHEPLDLDGVRAEEDAFWSETWDEPEEL